MMKKRQIFIFLFLSFPFFLYAQDNLEQKLESNENFILFYKEMRGLLFLYLEKSDFLTKEKMQEMEKRSPNIIDTNKVFVSKKSDFEEEKMTQEDKKYFQEILNSYLKIKQMNFTEREKYMDSVENVIDEYAKNDILERKQLKISEIVYREAIQNARTHIHKVFDEYPVLLERKDENSSAIIKTIESLDKKYTNQPKSKCLDKVLDFSALGLHNFLRAESYVYQSNRKKKRVEKISPMTSHTSFLTSIYKYKKCKE